MGLYAVGGGVVLCLFIVLCWFAFHKQRSPLDQESVKTEAAKPHARHAAPAFEPADDLSSEEPTNQPNDSASTNAAVIYRQAFAHFDELSKEQKTIASDWRTNVDASVEAELCEKIRPICDLMHQASAVTNCDWGDKRLTFEDNFGRHLSPSRAVARAAIWNAAHCRSNDVAGATDDTLAALRLGQQVSQGAMIGCLVGMAMQQMSSSYISQNIGSFRGGDAQRLLAALDDSVNEEAPSRAMEAEADMVERLATKLAAMSEAELKKNWPGDGTIPAEMDRAAVLAEYRQIRDSERELARALASSSEGDYEAWQARSVEVRASNPLAKGVLESIDPFVNKVRQAAVNRAMVVAGLAVAETGPEVLATHPDPASGKPFVYTETDDGFELQSAYKFNGAPMKMQFK